MRYGGNRVSDGDLVRLALRSPLRKSGLGDLPRRLDTARLGLGDLVNLTLRSPRPPGGLGKRTVRLGLPGEDLEDLLSALSCRHSLPRELLRVRLRLVRGERERDRDRFLGVTTRTSEGRMTRRWLLRTGDGDQESRLVGVEPRGIVVERGIVRILSVVRPSDQNTTKNSANSEKMRSERISRTLR